ncbi:hypothetical protein WEI85_28565 [Actinomycetes bacterium KLBMP 9797]
MISRRVLASLGLGVLGGAAVAAAPARAAAPLEIVARRKQITLPQVPAIGGTYIATFTLTDPAGAALGEAAAHTALVDVTPEGPVMLSQVVLKLRDGEVHYQRIMNRFGPFPRTAVGAIVGATGAHAGRTGAVDITWPDADTIKIKLP